MSQVWAKNKLISVCTMYWLIQRPGYKGSKGFLGPPISWDIIIIRKEYREEINNLLMLAPPNYEQGIEEEVEEGS